MSAKKTHLFNHDRFFTACHLKGIKRAGWPSAPVFAGSIVEYPWLPPKGFVWVPCVPLTTSHVMSLPRYHGVSQGQMDSEPTVLKYQSNSVWVVVITLSKLLILAPWNDFYILFDMICAYIFCRMLLTLLDHWTMAAEGKFCVQSTNCPHLPVPYIYISYIYVYIWNQGSIVTWYIGNWEVGSIYTYKELGDQACLSHYFQGLMYSR